MIRRQVTIGFEIHRIVLAQVGIEHARQCSHPECAGHRCTQVAIPHFNRTNTQCVRLSFQGQVVESIVPFSVRNIEVDGLDITGHIIGSLACQVYFQLSRQGDTPLGDVHRTQIAVSYIQR